ncbi:MAG: hypothetical protein R2850_11905 [Bacteroidia bacterium]
MDLHNYFNCSNLLQLAGCPILDSGFVAYSAFVGINARMISSTALATIVPKQEHRGAFMALDSSLQQVAGGIAASAAGLIVYQAADGMIHGFPMLGWTVIEQLL